MANRERSDRKKAIRAMSESQLKEELGTLKKEQFNLRFQQATNQLEKTSRVRFVRRDIATIRTLLRQQAEQSAEQEA